MTFGAELKVTEIFATLEEAWILSEADNERLDVIIRSMDTAISYFRHATGQPQLFAPLDELKMALEKLAMKSDDAVSAFLYRDTTNAQLTPAIELQAYYVLVYRIFLSVSPPIAEKNALKETIKALDSFPLRSASTIRSWHSNIEFPHSPARNLYHQLREIAQRAGYFGLPLLAAQTVAKQEARRAANRLLTPPD